MATMSDLNRDEATILAVWPSFQQYQERWFMEVLVENDDASLSWRDSVLKDDNGRHFSESYDDKEAAVRSAIDRNFVLEARVEAKTLDPLLKKSLQLKILKSLQSKQRLQNEEELMLKEAIRKHANSERPTIESIKLAPASEQYRNEVFDVLTVMPYLKIVRVGKSGERKLNTLTLYQDRDGTWSKPYAAGDKAVKYAERAKIANAFGLPGHAHWGRTKATIRQTLLPRANQLLQLASVQHLLSEALARGELVIVSNGVVFWYEKSGQIGWQVKETSSTKDSKDTAIWKEGTICSTNHGRLIVLPYIKDNGEYVKGHTKNGPNDGKALPRHPDHYVDIPFKLYDGDLMIGLYGELPYE